MHLNTVTKYKYCYHLPLRAKHQISLFCPWASHLLWINGSAKWLLASTLPVYTSQTMFLTIPERPLYEWHWYAEVSKTINAQATGSYCVRSRWHIRNGSVRHPWPLRETDLTIWDCRSTGDPLNFTSPQPYLSNWASKLHKQQAERESRH